jgi:hypothetical protein
LAYLVTLAAVADASMAISATAIISLEEAMAIVGLLNNSVGQWQGAWSGQERELAGQGRYK